METGRQPWRQGGSHGDRGTAKETGGQPWREEDILFLNFACGKHFDKKRFKSSNKTSDRMYFLSLFDEIFEVF